MSKYTVTSDRMIIGPSKPKGKWRYYSYIKIGDDIIKHVYIKEKFDVILRSQLTQSGDVTLTVINWCLRPLIIAITQDDGQVFRQGAGVFYKGLVAMFVFAILVVFFLPAFDGMAFVVLLCLASLIIYFGARLCWVIRTLIKIRADYVF